MMSGRHLAHLAASAVLWVPGHQSRPDEDRRTRLATMAVYCSVQRIAARYQLEYGRYDYGRRLSSRYRATASKSLLREVKLAASTFNACSTDSSWSSSSSGDAGSCGAPMGAAEEEPDMQWWKRTELWLAVVAAVLLLQGYLEIRLGGDRPAGWFFGLAGLAVLGFAYWRYRLTKQQQAGPPQ
jgi:hypothetical protein